MDVTTDDVHDFEALPYLVREASKRMVLAKAYMDAAYDSSKSYRLLKSMKIEAFIKPRKNARVDRWPLKRRRKVKPVEAYGGKLWIRMIGYGGRWIVETAF